MTTLAEYNAMEVAEAKDWANKPKGEGCQFNLAWRGPCKKPLPCPEHTDLKCKCCGAPATGECEETMCALVCGALLCDGCTHTTFENGSTRPDVASPLPYHTKIGEQLYLPWFMRGL